MKVLMFSLDQALINQTREGDTLKRLLAYAQHCELLTVVVPVSKGKKRSIKNVKILPAQGKSQLSRYLNVFRLGKNICRQQKPDLIVTNDAVLGAIAIWLKKNLPVKVQINIFGLEILDKHWLKERWQNIILKLIQEWAIKRVDGLRVDNSKEKKLLVKHYRIASQKIIVIPIAPSKKSQQRFLRAKPNRQLKKQLLGNNKHLVLSVGSLVKAKDFLTLITAAERVVKIYPDTLFVIAGEGPERKRIEEEIKKRNLQENVKLLGSISYERLPKLFISADLFMLSSSHEGFPRVVMEAALASRPIVTTAIDGIENLIKNKHTGLVVPVKDPHKLAEAIIKLLSDPARAKEMGRRAKDLARSQLDFNKAVKKLTTSWKSLINEK